jgi:hypothetical protein
MTEISFVTAEIASGKKVVIVCNKSVYTFINSCSSIMSDPIKLKPIPVHFLAHSAYISE